METGSGGAPGAGVLVVVSVELSALNALQAGLEEPVLVVVVQLVVGVVGVVFEVGVVEVVVVAEAGLFSGVWEEGFAAPERVVFVVFVVVEGRWRGDAVDEGEEVLGGALVVVEGVDAPGAGGCAEEDEGGLGVEGDEEAGGAPGFDEGVLGGGEVEEVEPGVEGVAEGCLQGACGLVDVEVGWRGVEGVLEGAEGLSAEEGDAVLREGGALVVEEGALEGGGPGVDVSLGVVVDGGGEVCVEEVCDAFEVLFGGVVEEVPQLAEGGVGVEEGSFGDVEGGPGGDAGGEVVAVESEGSCGPAVVRPDQLEVAVGVVEGDAVGCGLCVEGRWEAAEGREGVAGLLEGALEALGEEVRLVEVVLERVLEEVLEVVEESLLRVA